MNKPLAIGLIIFFLLVITGGVFWLIFGPETEPISEETRVFRRFPFGIFGEEEKETPSDTQPAEEVPEGERSLTRLTEFAVSGFAPTKTGMRFIEKSTGHVFDIGPKGETKTRISNTTIPKIFGVEWSPDASKAILKYVSGEDDVRVISASFTAGRTSTDEQVSEPEDNTDEGDLTGSTQGTLLPSSIIDITYSPERERILYFTPAGEGSRLIAADPDNTNQNDIFTTILSELTLDWPNGETITLQTAPSSISEGLFMTYDIQTGHLEKPLKETGLSAKLSPEGKTIIFSTYDNDLNLPRLFVYDTDTKETRALNEFTLADKCSFSLNSDTSIYCGIDSALLRGDYPEDWLTGTIQTGDSIWKINTESGERTLLSDEIFFDITEIKMSPDEKFLYFKDKKTDSVWSLEVSQ